MAEMGNSKGYYAMVPRIVRKEYKTLSATEKWLYTCLKDLCGDTGTCYRTIRVLAKEAGISNGSASMMIRHLEEVGLINAEKKPRRPGGHEVWHITIVDIWEQNKQYCSINERK